MTHRRQWPAPRVTPCAPTHRPPPGADPPRTRAETSAPPQRPGTRKPTRRPWRPLLATTATVLLVTACTSTPPDSTQSAPTTTVTSGEASATPMSGGYEVDAEGRLVKPHRTLTPPTLSTTATAHTADGAQAFARHFVAVTQYAWNTGDTIPLQDISTHDCQMCQNIIDKVNARYTAGGWVDGLTYQITQIETAVEMPDSAGEFAVVVHVTTLPHVIFGDDGLQQAGKLQRLIELHNCWIQDSWRACGGIATPDPAAT